MSLPLSMIMLRPRAAGDLSFVTHNNAKARRLAAADLLDKLPEELGRGPEAALLRKVADRKVYNIVHLATAPRTMRGLRRIMSSHAGAWTTTGVPGIPTRSILCAIAKCSSSPPTRKASSLSTSPWTDVNRQARLYQEGLGVGETPPTQPP